MNTRSVLPGAALLVLATTLSISPIRAEEDRCLRANVPAPILFPNGVTHPAGLLTLCVTDYSPVASYHEVRLDGMPVGMLFSHRRTVETLERPEPFVLFRPTDSGALRLVGYVWPAGRQSFSYLLQGEPWDARGSSRILALEAPARPSDEDDVGE